MNSSILVVCLMAAPILTYAQDCSEIKEDVERLACYDAGRTADSVPDAEPEAHAKEPGSTAPSAGVDATVAAESPEEFGKKEVVDAPREFIEGTIVEVASIGDTDYIRLDNGQVWRETKEGNLRFKAGRKVKITEGILNSYDLTMDGSNKIVKVKRVR